MVHCGWLAGANKVAECGALKMASTSSLDDLQYYAIQNCLRGLQQVGGRWRTFLDFCDDLILHLIGSFSSLAAKQGRSSLDADDTHLQNGMLDAIFLSYQLRLHKTILVLCVKRNRTGLLNNICQLQEHKIHTASLSQAKTVF